MSIRCLGYSVERPIIREEVHPWTGTVSEISFASYQIFWWLDEQMRQHWLTVEDDRTAPEFEIVPMAKNHALLIHRAGEFTVFSGRDAERRAEEAFFRR